MSRRTRFHFHLLTVLMVSSLSCYTAGRSASTAANSPNNVGGYSDSQAQEAPVYAQPTAPTTVPQGATTGVPTPSSTGVLGTTSTTTATPVTEVDSAEPEPAAAEAVDTAHYFYFSYDDSASTASVEIIKAWAARNEDASGWISARVYEFLSFENFDSPVMEDHGVFDTSMGITQRIAPEGGWDYKLGVNIASPTIDIEQRRNIVLTLVVDISGSMSESVGYSDPELTKLQLIQQGLQVMLEDALKEGDVVNIVVFDDRAETRIRNASFPRDAQRLRNAIEELETRNSTDLNLGIRRGYEVARASFDPNKTNRVLILTDAYANTGEVDPAVVSRETVINGQEGIYFSGLGIGEEFNEAFLNELTEAGKGAYFAVNTRTDARRAFSERFISLLSVAARDVRFRLDFPESMRRTVTASEESSTVMEEVQPTNFSYNTSQYFLEGFRNPDGESAPEERFVLTIYWTDPATGETREVRIEKTLAELLSNRPEKDNIAAAEAIFIFTEYYNRTKTYGQVEEIFSAHYANSTTPLVLEYRDLIDRIARARGDLVE